MARPRSSVSITSASTTTTSRWAFASICGGTSSSASPMRSCRSAARGCARTSSRWSASKPRSEQADDPGRYNVTPFVTPGGQEDTTMGNSKPRTLVLSALAATMLTQPAAALPQGASLCQKTTARRLLVLGTQAGDCVKACHDDDAAGTSRRCGVAAPDDQLARCLERAKRKAVKGILRTCTGAACPECYAGANCRTFAEAQAEAAVQGSGLLFDSFYSGDD